MNENMQQTGGVDKRPSSLEMGEYELGLLSPARAREVAAYLRQHPHAAAQLDTLRQFLSDLDPQPEQPSMLAELKILVAQLVQGGAQWAAVRGETEGVYQVGEVQIVLETDSDLEHPAQKVLVGVAMGIGGTAELWTADQPQLLQTASLDEDGSFMLTAVAPGVYELVLRGEETAVHIPYLHIG